MNQKKQVWEERTEQDIVAGVEVGVVVVRMELRKGRQIVVVAVGTSRVQ